MRRSVLVLSGIALLFALILAGSNGAAVLAQDDATPEAETTETEDLVEEQEEVAEATPTPEPIQVITLVMWYQTSATGEVIEVGPLNTNDQLIAGPGDPATGITGTAELLNPDLDVQAQITVGDSVFDGVEAIPGNPDSVFRWTFPGGEPGERPATLVVEVVATAGPYEGATGVATFASRSTPGSGVLVIMLTPPT